MKLSGAETRLTNEMETKIAAEKQILRIKSFLIKMSTL